MEELGRILGDGGKQGITLDPGTRGALASQPLRDGGIEQSGAFRGQGGGHPRH